MVQVQARASAKPQALAGVRVVDFTWVRAGPWATRWLGALGAEVIKVEWPLVGPGRRGGRAMNSDVDSRNNSGHFDDTNANKLGFTIDVRSTKGMELIRRLISVSDIVIENFSPRVMRSWGLGYEDLCKLRPDIIYISQSGFGHSGRNTEYLTMGHSAQAVSGMTYLSGLPDKPPAGWGWSYLDDTGGMYVALSAITAIYHRNITGHGQHVDQSQMMTGMVLNGPAHLDFSINGRPSYRPGYPPGNRTHWPGTPLVNNYRGRTVAPHNAYRTSPEGYNDWCAIACSTDDEWQRLVGVMGSPAWAIDNKFANLSGRLAHQEELDRGIESWTKTLGKYELMDRCQAVGVRAMPVQSNEDRVENDPQLRHREMYIGVEHPNLGNRKLQNAPFKLSNTPAWNQLPAPLIGQHNREILEGILGMSHDELVAGYEDGTFWPKGVERLPYIEEIIQAGPLQVEEKSMVYPGSSPLRSGNGIDSLSPHGPLSGLRVLELADEKGQWCGKMMGDLGADVIKIEPLGGSSTRSVGPFLDDIPNRERSLSFWHYNTSKRGITINLESEDGRDLFRRLASKADVILESFRPGYLPSLGLGYEDLSRENQGLIMCSLTPFGQTGPWRDYLTSDMLHLAAGGQMASCGYDAADEPDAPPIAAVGGQAWHMGGHYAYIGITAALVNRTVTGKGQYVDASVHEACALTTEGAISNWIDNGKVVQRQTGRHAAITPSAQTQYRCKDGKYVSIRHIGGLSPQQLQTMAKWMEGYGMAGDLLDEKYKDSAIILEDIKHIDEVVIEFIKNNTRDVVYHGFQQLGFSWGAVRTPDEQLDDGHLQDRGFWLEVEHPELGRSFQYPGSAAIWSESPFSISRRAPLIGEHNEEVLCGELGLTRAELSVLTEGGSV